MKLAIVLLAFFFLRVQGLPRKQISPLGPISFHPTHLIQYVQELAANEPMSRSADVAGGKLTNSQCYSKSTSAWEEINEKLTVGNKKCDNILAAAEELAQTNLENDRKDLDAQSIDIQNNLKSCQSNTDLQGSIECYQKEGQSNISPVSSLSSNARTAQRQYVSTISAATIKSSGCSYDISEQSETLSIEVYNSLNNCLKSHEWNDILIPDFGPAEPTTELNPVVTPEVSPESTPGRTPEETTEITQEMTSEVTSKETTEKPEVTPEPTPQETPGVESTTDDSSGETSDITPEANSNTEKAQEPEPETDI